MQALRRKTGSQSFKYASLPGQSKDDYKREAWLDRLQTAVSQNNVKEFMSCIRDKRYQGEDLDKATFFEVGTYASETTLLHLAVRCVDRDSNEGAPIPPSGVIVDQLKRRGVSIHKKDYLGKSALDWGNELWPNTPYLALLREE